MQSSPPKILLLYKISTYAYYFHYSSRQQYANRLKNISRFKKTHQKHYRTLAAVESFFKERNIPYSRSRRGRKINFSRFDVVISVGGDGTFLEAARSCTHQAILGINSDPQWSVGRFCIADDKNFSEVLEAVIHKKHKIFTANRLRFQVKGRPETVNVLNDILISHVNPAAMSRYLIGINRHKEEQRSSGVWVSTAAGSTGAIRSAGGKMLPFSSHRWQYMPRELYGNYRKSSLKGGVLTSKQALSIISLMTRGVAYIDGCHFKYPLHMGGEVVIKKSNQPLKMITL